MADVRTPYPLTWPSGWPRTMKRREPARFSFRGERGYAEQVTMPRARDRLEVELDKLGARDPLLSTNVELTLNGAPRAGRPVPTDPGAAIYFQLKGKPVALACDRWSRVEDNIVALAKHIEALRGMDRWGVGTVEQAFTGYAALPAAAAKRHWTEVMGLDPWAPSDLIRVTYRQLARDRAHDQAMLLELNIARDEAVKERG